MISQHIKKHCLSLNNSKKKIDVLLCDLKLPNKNGIDSAKELLSIQPQMKVIISSGYIYKEEELKKIKEKGWLF